MIHRALPALAAVLLISCSGPGVSPPGQPSLETLTRPDSVIERFNRASIEQVQVVAMFSPT